MGIDDEVDLLPGSDHIALRVDLRLGSSDSVDPPSTSPGFYLNPKRDVMRVKCRMDELLNELDWDNLYLDEQCSKLQSILVEANVEAYGSSPDKVRRLGRTVRLKD